MILSAPVLWRHTSPNGEIGGRYSLPYTTFLLLHAGAAVVLVAIALHPALLGKFESLLARGSRVLERRLALAAALALPWLLLAAAALVFRTAPLARSAALYALGTVAVLCATLGAIVLARPGPRRFARSATKYLIIVASLGVALSLLEGALAMNPGLLPQAVLRNLPDKGQVFSPNYIWDGPEIGVGYRYVPGVRIATELKASDANLYADHLDLIRPVPREEDQVLSRASFTADEIGYRNPSPLRVRYPIVVSGDSFTSHSVAPVTWPDVLSERLGVPVLNLGLDGYGTQSEVEAVVRYGLGRKPAWVIIAYYEGNDLLNAADYEERKRSGLGWRNHVWSKISYPARFLTVHLASHGLRALTGWGPSQAEEPDEYPYPFTVHINGHEVELGFSTTYLSVVSVPKATIENLESFGAVLRSFERLALASAAGGARLLVAYVPTKERCYAPLLPLDLLEAKVSPARVHALSADGKALHPLAGSGQVTARELLANLDGQRDAMIAALESRNVPVLDLTPALRGAASRGEPVYFVNDNHWTPAGSRIAAVEIETRLRRDAGEMDFLVE